MEIRWSLENSNNDKETLIENIECCGLVMNQNDDLFVSDEWNHAVKRWRKGEIGTEGIIVAGGNGWRDELNQLNLSSGLSFDAENNLYVVDSWNNRIQQFRVEG